MEEKRTVFALDTGTRTVVGVVAEVGPDWVRILASAVAEHHSRAMLDGQIHNVDEVARVVIKIKNQLEQKLNTSLKRVTVAAAGRALVTLRQTVNQELSPWHEIKAEQVRSLELEAIRSAQQSLMRSREIRERYYCVGYSIISYQLDGGRIGNPVGQRGKLLSVELLGTFLPQIVVDSLIAVLDRAGLEMEVMTLEPIAALELVMPATMRQLNIALVDIGAGTSDIAITADGSVTAFAMVPLAGDEITEQLCSSYLLDFMVGEKIKRKLSKGGVLTFKDILGVRQRVPAEQLLQSLRGTIREIALKIGNTILQLNGGPPQAVLCIGGGSLTPGLTDELAAALGLPASRVAVRTAGGVGSVKGLSRSLAGPAGVTPLGIALMANRPQAMGLAQVQVNDRTVRLFRGTKATVADALVAAGLGFTELHGRPGNTLTIKVNGELRIIKGGEGEPAEIRLNGARAQLDTPLPAEARIRVGEPRGGTDARATVREILPDNPPLLKIFINGEEKVLEPVVMLNDHLVGLDTPVQDHASLTWHPVKTVGDALHSLGFSEARLEPRRLELFFNGKQRVISLPVLRVFKNGFPAGLVDSLQDGDQLVYEPLPAHLRVTDLLELEGIDLPEQKMGISVNGESLIIRRCGMRILKNGAVADREDVVVDGDELQISAAPAGMPIFADIFNYIDFEPVPPSPTARLVMLRNGEDARFTTPIREGDKLLIYWKDDPQSASDDINQGRK